MKTEKPLKEKLQKLTDDLNWAILRAELLIAGAWDMPDKIPNEIQVEGLERLSKRIPVLRRRIDALNNQLPVDERIGTDVFEEKKELEEFIQNEFEELKKIRSRAKSVDIEISR